MSLTSINNTELASKIELWFKWDKNEENIEKMKKMVAENDITKLEKIMLNRLIFGTAGIRGKMEPGFSGMNDLVLIQTSQGLAKYVMETEKDVPRKGVVIGYDARYNSKRWAELTAAAFISLNVKVYLYSDICPTPFIPFSVVHFGCSCGVMVTASHNPKDDNGYKVYWSNGAQIIPPHDKEIQKSIEKYLEPWPNAWDIETLKSNPLCVSPDKEICSLYYSHLASSLTYKNLIPSSSLKITFTPMHGVSQKYMEEAFRACGFPTFISVDSQKDPDPDFPTAPFPNPEEKGALNESFKVAKASMSTIILANDPDADRMAVAELQKDGTWHTFTGNEIGALLGWWMWHCFREKDKDTPSTDVYMIASAVSSKILKSIAEKENFNFEETLTGFKWMGNRADELVQGGKTVLFAFEEAIGFMCGIKPLDKDGIGACVKMTELAIYLQVEENLTLLEKLKDLFTSYGVHVNNNSYYLCYEPPVVTKIFHRLRNYSGDETYPDLCGPFKIVNVRDLTTGYDSSEPNKIARLPSSTSSQMLTFYLENGCVLNLRTSGTEPKIKYYTEICGKPSASEADVKKELEIVVKHLVDDFLQPSINNLQAPIQK